MSIVYRSIAFDELASFVELPDDLFSDSEALSEIIAICGSFLTVREDTIIFVHYRFHKKDLDIDERGCVGDFLQTRFLHWLEALSILGSISHGIAAMLKLEGFLQVKNGEPLALLERVQDASRFIRYHRLAIENCPL
ncbi:unnamed protein product [Penicillium salamii]|uniref:Uncharacterized protein n=1 Tax=Penicillium salamii TaxID=1612424 RepID=A0A9W4N4T4_9EURO|nr:unnamed protein product [Penicillium salamii]